MKYLTVFIDNDDVCIVFKSKFTNKYGLTGRICDGVSISYFDSLQNARLAKKLFIGTGKTYIRDISTFKVCK